jgi:chromosome segregation ATPase
LTEEHTPVSHDDRQRAEPALPGAVDDPAQLFAELTRVSALLADERAYFRSELARGAEELAGRDELVEKLRARGDELAARCDLLIARRDQLREQKNRLDKRRLRLVDQRDRARAELERYESSGVVRLAARMVWRLRRLRRRG